MKKDRIHDEKMQKFWISKWSTSWLMATEHKKTEQ